MTQPAESAAPAFDAEALVEELVQRIGADKVSTDAATREEASRDYAWLSPVLTGRLPSEPADVVVFPKETRDIQRILQCAYRHEVAVTPRGKGTGNYGQAVPLRRGIVLDLSRMDRIERIEPGRMKAQCGAVFNRLESAANQDGQELSIFPSTTNSQLGGFLSGGSGGTGSVEFGFAWNGFVLELTIVPCTEEAEPFTVSGEETLNYIHCYGTTGIMAEAVIKLVPRREWTGVFASFEPADGWQKACAAGKEIMQNPVIPRLVSVDQPGFVAYYPPHPMMPPDRISLRVTAEASMVGQTRAIIEKHGGTFEGDSPKAPQLLTVLSYNHVTLRAKQADPGVCHIQVGGPVVVEKPEEVCACIEDGRLHLDGMKQGDSVGYGGIMVGQWKDKDTLYAAVDRLRELGVYIVDPHHWYLGFGHFPKLEAILPVAAEMDPKGLLNPGRFPPEEILATGPR